MVVDASGLSLKRALEAGVYLVKPSLSEFRELIGNPMNNETDCVSACRSLIDDGRVEMVALTLGDQGALLVSREQALRAQALAIKPVSVVGAGDSFLGAMIWSLSSGQSIEVCISIRRCSWISDIDDAGDRAVSKRGCRTSSE